MKPFRFLFAALAALSAGTVPAESPDLAAAIVTEFSARFDEGPDAASRRAPLLRPFLLEAAEDLAAGRLLDRPNRDWGSAYDATVRDGADDPALRWMSVAAQHKWGWDAQALEQLEDLELRVAGPDATPLQKLLAAQARQWIDPSPEHRAALLARLADWKAALPDGTDTEAFEAGLLGPALAAEDRTDGGNGSAGEEDRPEPRPAGPLHEDFVRDAYFPLLWRECAEPADAAGGGGDEPWRAEALAALRDWLLWTARGEFRPDPGILGRAASAAGRGCPWPAIRYLAAVKRFSFEPADAADAGAADMRKAVREALADPATTPLGAYVLLRDCAARVGDGSFAAETSAAFERLARSRPWTGAGARALWWLRRDGPAWGDASLSERLWGAGTETSGGASSNAWLRAMMRGAAARKRAWDARGTQVAPDGACADPEAFERELGTARSLFERASELEPAFPEGPWQMVGVLHGRPAEARRWLDETVRREFDCPGVRDQYLWGLRPRWGGSVGAMIAFGDECLASGRFDTAVPRFWGVARFAAASELGDRWEEAFRGSDAADAAERIVRAAEAGTPVFRPIRTDARYLAMWPAWANGDLEAFAGAANRWEQTLPTERTFDPKADFDDIHPMHFLARGLAFGLTERNGRELRDAVARWRDGEDPRNVRKRLEAVVADPAGGAWEKSLASEFAAEIGAVLSAETGEPYSLVPRDGRSSRRMFWRSWNGWVALENGAWRAGSRVGELETAGPVLPADFSLAVAVRPGTDGDPSVRFHLAAEPRFWSAGPTRTLLLERNAAGGWSLGWAELSRFFKDGTLESDEAFEREGPSVPVAPEADGCVRFELRAEGGSARVFAGGKELRTLARADAFPRAPHHFGIAGRNFALAEATARGLPGSERDSAPADPTNGKTKTP